MQELGAGESTALRTVKADLNRRRRRGGRRRCAGRSHEPSAHPNDRTHPCTKLLKVTPTPTAWSPGSPAASSFLLLEVRRDGKQDASGLCASLSGGELDFQTRFFSPANFFVLGGVGRPWGGERPDGRPGSAAAARGPVRPGSAGRVSALRRGCPGTPPKWVLVPGERGSGF